MMQRMHDHLMPDSIYRWWSAILFALYTILPPHLIGSTLIPSNEASLYKSYGIIIDKEEALRHYERKALNIDI